MLARQSVAGSGAQAWRASKCMPVAKTAAKAPNGTRCSTKFVPLRDQRVGRHEHRWCRPATPSLACRALPIEPVPPGLRIEAKEEDGTTDVEYDDDNKVVRIPLSALGPEGRRSKLVLFTCNKCGGRTARLVNPIAWEKGAVFAQCSKCHVWHVLSAPNKKIFEEVRYNAEEGQGGKEGAGQSAGEAVAAAAAEPPASGSAPSSP